jgi:hypothetical protein
MCQDQRHDKWRAGPDSYAREGARERPLNDCMTRIEQINKCLWIHSTISIHFYQCPERDADTY